MKAKYILPFSFKELASFITICLLIISYNGLGQVSMTNGGSSSQSFNTLSDAGGAWTDNSTITNWYWQNSYEGSSYTGDDGSSQPTLATRYAYHTLESPDMAIGGIATNSDNIAMGVQLKNNSGATIDIMKVSYTGEQWHFGGNTISSKITFWYKISSTRITDLMPGDNTGWTAINALDFTSPVFYSGDPMALDGNASANRRTFVNISIPNLNIPSGNYIMLRWSYPEQNTTHGLAIDDVSVSWIGNTINNRDMMWSLLWTNGTPNTITNAIIDTKVIADINGTCYNLIINSAKTLTINSGITINVIGNCLIKSSSTGVGSLLNQGTLSIAGASNVEMYIPLTTLHNGIYFTPPLSSITASSVSDLVYRYNASTCTWTIVYNQLIPGTGYTVRSDNEIIKTLSGGSFRNADLNLIGLVRQASPQNYGWNLVGNPFVCGLDWEVLNNTASNYTNLTNGFYIRASDGSLKSYVNGVGNPAGTSSVIPPFQAFYAQVIIGQTTGSINMPLNARTNNTHIFYKNLIPIVRLQISSMEGYTDETVIRIDDNATDKLDNLFDGNKMFADNDNDPQIFSLSSDNEELCINAIAVNNITTIPIGFKSIVDGEYKIKSFDFANVDKSISLYLKDNQTNVMQNLREQPVYTFNTLSTFNTDRFILILSKQATGICKDYASSKVLINSVNKSVIIDLQGETNGRVEIYTVLGEQILNKQLIGSSLQKIDLSVSAGIYIVKVYTSNSTIAKKIFIK